MNKVTIVFDYSVDGHHLEYLNHIYNDCINKESEKFIFIVPEAFKLVSNKLVWPTSQNVKIVFIDSVNFQKFKENGIKRSFYLCQYLKTQIKKYDATDVFLISLMEFMPFLSILINKKTKISGIIYLIYLYRWKGSTMLSKISDAFKYILFSRSGVFKNIFLLNDTVAPIYLNRKFKTSKFKYLPDPFMPLSNTGAVDLRNELNISKEKIVCLHFGALTERKGTLGILQSILEMNPEKAKRYSFIFAGKVSHDIKDVFYSLVDDTSKLTEIIIYDEYVDYDFLGSLCLISNYILIPYKNTEQSSGVISYAAQFKVPVVAPRLGLLGKIIKRNKLGILLDNSSSESIKEFLNNSEDYNFFMNTNYLENNQVSKFVNLIFKE
ncbi:hypothetical protein GJU43_05650 [Flavobacterium sp. LC2016-23]|uniref:hypothetical protein n=1 Tax=Flavobacterium sp. LC2016-23 TaxID=2666330 RepID=UPI0012B14BBA|nr:hypothetical protein [Flavobacterium sp. LC2016-23]MRX38749.1 hypothetical protein [Flavobacterium sp. LC2016-23]